MTPEELAAADELDYGSSEVEQAIEEYFLQ